MPAQQKLTPAEKSREKVIWYLTCLSGTVREHQHQTTEKDFTSPTFCHRSEGMFAHHSEYKKDALFGAYKLFGKEYSKLANIFGGSRWRTSHVAQGKSMEKLIALSQLIRDIFDSDYIFGKALWRGGTMRLSQEVESAANKANIAMQRVHKMMVSRGIAIQTEFAAMRKYLEEDRKVSASQPKTISPKSKRANNVKKLQHAISVQ